jgi:hypothetical protein
VTDNEINCSQEDCQHLRSSPISPLPPIDAARSALTQRNDNTRSGAYLQEAALTPTAGTVPQLAWLLKQHNLPDQTGKADAATIRGAKPRSTAARRAANA